MILNSIWFPFQTSPGLTQSRRTTLLARVRQVLARLCSSLDIAVIPQLYAYRHCHLLIRLEKQVVVTTQLATKLLNPDGTLASFDSGSRAVLVPLLGESVLSLVPSYGWENRLTLTLSTYLPPHRTYRVLIVPETRTSGFEFFRLHHVANPKQLYF